MLISNAAFQILNLDDSAFCLAADLGLTDALRPLPGTRDLFRDGLPRTAYTIGDTSGTQDDKLPSRYFTQLPCRVIRRYSPVDLETNGGHMQSPRPTYLNIVREDNDSRSLYPIVPPRLTTTQQLKQNQDRVRITETEEVMDFTDIVSAPPGAAQFLAALGMPVPKEALATALPRRLARTVTVSARSFARESPHALIFKSTREGRTS